MLKKIPFSSCIIFLAFCAYSFFFYQSLGNRLLNPEWTTDDAMQQTFVLHDVYNSDIFKDDIIYKVMKGYLTPVHYWISYAATWVTDSPIMGGHIVMLIQLGLTLVFFFLAIKAATNSWGPAFFAVAWLLHTRTLIERMTGGLPRGWAAVVFAAFLYGILSKRHGLTSLFLILGCLVHPPATFLCAAAYGLWLLFSFFAERTRRDGIIGLRFVIPTAMICVALAWHVVQRPPEIGQMVDFETASKMPAFQNPGGRFPFIPQPSIWEHFHDFTYNAFINKWFEPLPLVKEYGWIVIYGALLILLILGIKQKRTIVPLSLWSFLLAVAAVYLTSRQVMFKLYVPDRHLLFPMTFFMIAAFTTGCWNLATTPTGEKTWRGLTSLIVLAGIIFFSSGSGFTGDAQFRYHIHRKGRAFDWVKKYTPRFALIAGHPTHVDPVPLFGMRRAFVTSEVAHPFYPKYYSEMERRLTVSLKAHYATSFNEFLKLVTPEKIDYFIFSRQRFYPNNLKNETFFKPLDTLTKRLTSRGSNAYAYKKLPRSVDPQYPFVKFVDDQSTIIDIKELEIFLVRNPQFGE